jgi:hypothetical protein
LNTHKFPPLAFKAMHALLQDLQLVLEALNQITQLADGKFVHLKVPESVVRLPRA